MKLRIEKAIYGGDGLARIPAGKTVFVPATLPGELVEAHIAEERRGFANGRLDAILEPSPERVVPGCEYVPRCGGCQYQHANAAFQLQMKLDILKETLVRAHLPLPEEIGSLAGPPWGYRNRIRLHVMKRGLGYRQRGSHNLLPVTHCPIAAPLLEQAIVAVTRPRTSGACAMKWNSLPTASRTSSSSPSGPAVKAPSDRALEDFAERLKAELPALTGVGLFSGQSMKHWGLRSLTYSVSGHSYQVSLGSFFQVNRFLLPELLQLVLAECHAAGWPGISTPAPASSPGRSTSKT